MGGVRYFSVWCVMVAGNLSGWLIVEALWGHEIPTGSLGLGVHDTIAFMISIGLTLWFVKWLRGGKPL